MSEPEPDLAELRRAFAAIPPVAPAPESCPSSESILLAVRGELPPAELRNLIEHLAACPACTEDWRLAVALERPMAEDPAIAASPRKTWRARKNRLAVWFASAAAAAALFVSGLLWRMPDPTFVTRGGGSQTLQILTHDPVLPRDHVLLRWTKVPDATTYDLNVAVQDGSTIEAPGLTEPQYQVPAARFAGSPAGAAVTWRVTAHLRNGRHLASPLSTFVLR